MRIGATLLVGVTSLSICFGQSPTTFTYSISSPYFPFQSADQTAGQTGSLVGNWQSGPDGAAVAFGSIEKREGGHFSGELASYTELSTSAMGPATVRSGANASMFQQFQITGNGATLGLEGTINPTPEFGGFGRIRTFGSVQFTLRKRSGQNWNVLATRNRSIDISNGLTITDATNLSGIGLTAGDYRIETTFMAYSESKWTGVGYGEGLVDYEFAYYLQNLDGQVYSDSKMLLSNPVPEPSTVIGLAVGVLALRRKQRSSNRRKQK